MFNYRHKNAETGILWNDVDKNKMANKKTNYIKKDKNNLSFKDFVKKFI